MSVSRQRHTPPYRHTVLSRHRQRRAIMGANQQAALQFAAHIMLMGHLQTILLRFVLPVVQPRPVVDAPHPAEI
jgi:hypothetical protein